MLGKIVLICTDRTHTWGRASAPLAAAGNRVVRASSTDRALGLLWAGAVDLAVLDYPCGVEIDPVLDAARGRVPVVALSADPGRQSLLDLCVQRDILNVVTGGEDGAD